MKNIKLLIILPILVISFNVLSKTSDFFINLSALDLYKMAKQKVEARSYKQAIQYFKKIESLYPFSIYAQFSLMNIAYLYYLQDELESGLLTISNFITLYPYHNNIDYMYYLRGMIYLSLKQNKHVVIKIKCTECDPITMGHACNAFALLINRYPNSIYRSYAILRMKYLRNLLATYHLNVSKYYFCRHGYIASINRAQKIIMEYKDSSVIQEALYLMMCSYEELGHVKLSAHIREMIGNICLTRRFNAK